MYRLFEQAGLPEPSKDSSYSDFFSDPRGEARALSIALSALFEQHTVELLEQVRNAGQINPTELWNLSRPHVRQVNQASISADEVMNRATSDDYQERTRIRLQRLLTPQILLLPFIYAYPKAYPEARHYRWQLKRPMYSKLVNYASEVQQEMQLLDPDSKAHGRAKGALTEIVALGIGNRVQDSADGCIPSLYVSDRAGIDIHQFRYMPGQARLAGMYTGIQVKYTCEDPRERPGLCAVNGELLGVLPRSEPWKVAETFTTVQAMQHDLNGEMDVILGNCTVEQGIGAIANKLSGITETTLIDYPDIQFL